MRSPRDKFLRLSLCCFVVLALIIGITTFLGYESAVSHYNGFCYEFHGEEFTCTLKESVNNSIFAWSLVTCFLTPIPFFFWGIAVGRWLTPSMQLHPAVAIVLTAVLAITSGVLGFYVSFYFLFFSKLSCKRYSHIT